MWQPDCTGLEPLPAVQTAPLSTTIMSDPGAPAVWMLWALLVGIVVFDIWAILTRHHTISQRIQHLSKAYWWLKWLGFLGLAFLGWHIFLGFPWSLK